MGLSAHLPVNAGILCGSSLHNYCARCQRSCDFLCATFQLHLYSFRVVIHPLWLLWSLLLLFHRDPLALGEGVWDRYPISSWALSTLLFSTHWPIVGLSVNSYLLQEASLMRGKRRDRLFYGYSKKSLEVTLILCPFSNIIVVTSTLKPVWSVCLATVRHLDYGARSWYHLRQQA